MPITTGPAYWSAHVVPTSKTVTKEMRDEVYKIIGEGVLFGKGKRFRYLSDIRFPNEREATSYWMPFFARLPDHLRGLVEISEAFDLFF